MGPLYITHGVDQEWHLYHVKTPIPTRIVYNPGKISPIDIMSVKKFSPLSDAGGLHFCICPKVPFHTTLTIFKISKGTDVIEYNITLTNDR